MKGVTPSFKAALDAFMATNPAPEAVTAWVKERGVLPGDQVYVIYLMQTWRVNTNQRRALWQGWVSLQRSDQLEDKLLAFATSDLWDTRFDGLFFLRSAATWAKSPPALLKLLDVAHEFTNESACAVVEAAAKRARPPETVVTQFAERAGKVKFGPSRRFYARALSAFAAAGSTAAASAVRSAFDKGDAAEREILFDGYIRSFDPNALRQVLTRMVEDTSTEKGKALWTRAVSVLPEFGGEFGDIFLIARALPNTTPGGARDATVLNVVASLSRHARFARLDQLKPWLETIEPAYKNRASLIQAIKSDSAQASSAMDDLMDIRILDVDHALRGATRSHKAELRAKACEAIARRGDRKGVPAILEALREVTPETKARIDSSLAGFARGKVIPTESADRAIEWWMQNYPADFEE